MSNPAENPGGPGGLTGPEGMALPTAMTPSQMGTEPGTDRPRTHGHPHGKVSSWILIATVVIAFAVGGAAIATHLWWLFWTCVGIVVLAIPAGKVIRIMDDTVSYETSASLAHGTTPPPEHTADPFERPAG